MAEDRVEANRSPAVTGVKQRKSRAYKPDIEGINSSITLIFTKVTRFLWLKAILKTGKFG